MPSAEIEDRSSIRSCPRPSSNRTLAENKQSTDSSQGWTPKSRTSKSFVISLIFDIILLLGAVLFLILGYAAITRKNSPADGDFGSRIEEIMKWGPTIYPLLFAALMSRSLKSVGRYAAERGIQLSNLALLMNSTLIYDPLINLVYAPVSLFTVMLILLWACSPVGGQSSLRLVHKENITTSANEDLRYPDYGPIGQSCLSNQYEHGGRPSDLDVSMRDVFTASLTQKRASKLGPTDTWGNIKIPRFDLLEKNKSLTPDKDGWYDVDDLPNEVESWTALFGIPIIGLDKYDDRTITFSLKSTYMALSCGPVSFTSKRPVLYALEISCPECQSVTSAEGGGHVSVFDVDLMAARQYMYIGDPCPKLNATQARNESYTMAQDITIGSVGLAGTNNATCKIVQHPVETSVKCTYGKCGAKKTRAWKDNPFRGDNYTVLDLYAKNSLFLIKDSSQLSTQASNGYGAAQLFLNNSIAMPMQTGTFQQLRWNAGQVNLTQLPRRLLEARASILINTAAMAMYSAPSYFGDLPTSNMSIYGQPHSPDDNIAWAQKHISGRGFEYPEALSYWPNGETPFIAASTKALVETDNEVYNPNYAWCIILIVSSTTLITLGIGGIFCNIRAATPNMFDPVIGWTYLNPYLPLPENKENVLGAEARIGLLGKTRVRLGLADDVTRLNYSGEQKSSEEERVEQAEEGSVGQAEQDDRVSSATFGVVLGAIDRVQRLKRSNYAPIPRQNSLEP